MGNVHKVKTEELKNEKYLQFEGNNATKFWIMNWFTFQIAGAFRNCICNMYKISHLNGKVHNIDCFLCMYYISVQHIYTSALMRSVFQYFSKEIWVSYFK